MIKGDCRKPYYGLGDEEYIQFLIHLADRLKIPALSVIFLIIVPSSFSIQLLADSIFPPYH